MRIESDQDCETAVSSSSQRSTAEVESYRAGETIKGSKYITASHHDLLAVHRPYPHTVACHIATRAAAATDTLDGLDDKGVKVHHCITSRPPRPAAATDTLDGLDDKGVKVHHCITSRPPRRTPALPTRSAAATDTLDGLDDKGVKVHHCITSRPPRRTPALPTHAVV
ncbi:hypothetical protein J6590_023509 [Homalodisca vitripennis]|nr:hypothetical protein J6590_023509 [Homalodisca vitripennis]